jgi:hypothetical protein
MLEQPVASGRAYTTLQYMLHSKKEWKPHSGANQRLIGGRDIIKDLIVIRSITRTSRKNSPVQAVPFH